MFYAVMFIYDGIVILIPEVLKKEDGEDDGVMYKAILIGP